MKDEDYLDMMNDTSKLLAKKRADSLGNSVSSFCKSYQVADNVEFWKWVGRNYPNKYSSAGLLKEAAISNENTRRGLRTMLQGKGYEWDFMKAERLKPGNIGSKYYAGDDPSQFGIDVTKKKLFSGKVQKTYQNKAYVSTNNPDLHNTPKDAVVVTNKEKVAYAQKQGYETQEFMDNDSIIEATDKRLNQAESGNAYSTYTLSEVAGASAKAGAIGAVVGMTTEAVVSYKAWKNGDMTDDEYLSEILKSGGDAGVTAGATTAVMIPVQAAITTVGASSLIGIPVAFVMSSAINKVVAPCFGRGEYREILGKAKFYQNLEGVSRDFVQVAEQSANQMEAYVKVMQQQQIRHNQMKQLSKQLDQGLEDLYKKI